jgi:hypothetical protein
MTTPHVSLPRGLWFVFLALVVVGLLILTPCVWDDLHV